jgi:hypothetical protein
MQIDPVKNTKSVTVFLHQKQPPLIVEAILKVTSKNLQKQTAPHCGF